MEHARLTGPQASSIKYDLMTALSVMALNGSGTLQKTVLRLLALVTARYNWKLDQFSVAQRDISRLWNVDLRTVKREIRRMIDGDLIVCKRQGVRGRVGAYRLNYRMIYQHSEPNWRCVGPDFESRMLEFKQSDRSKVVKVDFESRRLGQPRSEGGAWDRVLAHLARVDPGNLRNWYEKLEFLSYDTETLRLKAPGKFIAQFVETHLSQTLCHAVIEEIGPVRKLEISC